MPGTPGEWGSAAIGLDGYYTVDSKWHRSDQNRTRYRICVVSNAKPGGTQMPSRSDGAGFLMVPTTLNSEKTDVCPAGAEHQLPERFSDLQTSGLTVTLGPEPARVDLDLRD